MLAVFRLNKDLAVTRHALERFHQRKADKSNPFAFFRRAFFQGRLAGLTLKVKEGIPVLSTSFEFDGFQVHTVPDSEYGFLILTITKNPPSLVKPKKIRYREYE